MLELPGAFTHSSSEINLSQNTTLFVRLRKVLTKYRMAGASHTGLTIQNLGYLGLSKLQAVTVTSKREPLSLSVIR